MKIIIIHSRGRSIPFLLKMLLHGRKNTAGTKITKKLEEISVKKEKKEKKHEEKLKKGCTSNQPVAFIGC